MHSNNLKRSHAAPTDSPNRSHYDVIIVGGAMYGSAIAWFLTDNPDFNGSILVVERDPSYASCSTVHTNSCIRQQFSNEVNIRISQFGADFIRHFRSYMGNDPNVPDLVLQEFGYMYLADNERFADVLRSNQQLQQQCGAGTKIMTQDEIRRSYPFYQLDDIIIGSHNRVDEGYFDGGTLFDWWKKSARGRGVEYLGNEVVAMSLDENQSRVLSVTLKSGDEIGCGMVVNASGPRAVMTSRMAGIEIPIEPRKRYTYIFDAAKPLDQDLPLTIDPTGVHMRTDGAYYLAGCPPDIDPGVDYDDFEPDHSLWQEKVWPVVASRIPQFEAIKLVNFWVGHYAFNVFDQNAVIGPHTQISNFIFSNGFSGHGLQQSPALGRGIAEWITYGEYRSLDLSDFGFDRIARNQPFSESAII